MALTSYSELINCIISTNNTNQNINKRCSNCGVIGHLSKQCREFICSYGLICYKYNKQFNKLEFILVNKKDSFSYIDFMKGNYNTSDTNYIEKLFFHMTVSERQNILNNTFDDLWYMLWADYLSDCNKYLNDIYENSKQKFNKIKNNNYFNDVLTNDMSVLYHETEWEFPKGKRKRDENNLQCAIREFSEETNIDYNNITIISKKQYQYLYEGINGKKYIYIFFLAKLRDENFNLNDNKSSLQLCEIKNVKWIDILELHKYIRIYNKHLIEFIEYINNIILTNFY